MFYTYKCKCCRNQYTVQHGMNETLDQCAICNADANNLVLVPTVNTSRIAHVAQKLDERRSQRTIEDSRKNMTSFIEDMKKEIKEDAEKRKDFKK